MKLLRPAALAIAGTTLALGASTAAPALAAPAAPAASPADSASVQREAGAQKPGSVDVASAYLGVANQILDLVVQQVETNDNREGVVNSLLEGTWYKHDQSKNVLVMKADHPYTADLQGVGMDAVYHIDGYPDFRVVVFDSGTVTNNGDGGYINWAFQGWFDRQDMTVSFHTP